MARIIIKAEGYDDVNIEFDGVMVFGADTSNTGDSGITIVGDISTSSIEIMICNMIVTAVEMLKDYAVDSSQAQQIYLTLVGDVLKRLGKPGVDNALN